MLADDFGEQERGNRRDHECHHGETQRMRQRRAVAALTPGKSGEQLCDAMSK